MQRNQNHIHNSAQEHSIVSFFKMEGCGNDYIFMQETEELIKKPFTEKEIRNMSHRNIGIGSDGLVLLSLTKGSSQLLMRMWNADGSSSKMCGNAIRCVALWSHKNNGLKEFTIESESGRHVVRVHSTTGSSGIVEVEMPPPQFVAKNIPFLETVYPDQKTDGLICIKLNIEGFGQQQIYVLSMGNPHCILFVDDIHSTPVKTLGPILESHGVFPERSNVNFVSQKPEGLFLRTYERGSGETLACGSGACASHVASILCKNASRRQKVFLHSGGELQLEWQGDIHREEAVLMRGPARWVYEGQFLRSQLL